MKILLSWSGAQSKIVAGALREWLRSSVPGADPWMSSIDIAPGTPWFDEVMGQLREAKFCVICLTPDNVRSPWLYFEAGAIAAQSPRPQVCGFLAGVSLSQLAPGPISQFQSVEADRDGSWQLVRAINRNLVQPHDELLLDAMFVKQWPTLKARLEYALVQYDPKSSDPTIETESLKPRYKLSKESEIILVEAASDRDGLILMTRTFDGLAIQANGKQFVDRKNRRSEALWQGALRKLVHLGLVESRGPKGEVFGITSEGYIVADDIRTNTPQEPHPMTE